MAKSNKASLGKVETAKIYQYKYKYPREQLTTDQLAKH